MSDHLEIRCPKLGGEVTFAYCLVEDDAERFETINDPPEYLACLQRRGLAPERDITAFAGAAF